MKTLKIVPSLVAGLAIISLPVAALGHQIIPWGAYPSAGGVTISTKAKRLLDETFLGQTLTVVQDPSVYEIAVGTDVQSVNGVVRLVTPKGTKAKLTVDSTAVDGWRPVVAGLVQQYRERLGDVVTDVAVTLKSAGGTATFKTKPSPIGPYHKANFSVTIKYRAVVTLEGGKTRSGTVTMNVTANGVRLGFPGED